MRALCTDYLRRISLTFLCSIPLFSGGCAKVEGKKFNPTEGVQESDAVRVRKWLEEANVKGEIMRIEEQSDGWIAEVQPPVEGGDRRKAVLGLKVYHVNKLGKVTDKGYTGG